MKTDHSEFEKDKIVLDFSDNPIREMQLIEVLSAMVRRAVARHKEASETNDHDPTALAPKQRLTGDEDTSIP
jgi:hypothetical protein